MDSNEIRKMPKVELHVHLEGTIRPGTFRHLMGRSKDDRFEWENHNFSYRDLPHFIQTMRSTVNQFLKKPENYYQLAIEYFQDLAEQNVIYAEVSFALDRSLRLGIPLDEILDAMSAAYLETEKNQSIKVGILAAIARYQEPEEAADLIAKTVEAKKEGFVGIDLHGDENSVGPELFKEAFEIARVAGLGLRAHAGEGTGADKVWAAINSLGISRVAHGVDAVKDLSLLQFLQGQPITLDVCPTSNVKLGVVSGLSNHPIRQLYDHGIRISVSSDDPFFFFTDVSREYQILIEDIGFSDEEIHQINLFSIDGAFQPEAEKEKLRAKLA